MFVSTIIFNTDTEAYDQTEKRRQGWEFLFLAANLDAIEVAANIGIGINRATNYHADSKGTQTIYAAINETVTQLRTKSMVSPGWSRLIEDDHAESRNERMNTCIQERL